MPAHEKDCSHPLPFTAQSPDMPQVDGWHGDACRHLRTVCIWHLFWIYGCFGVVFLVRGIGFWGAVHAGQPQPVLSGSVCIAVVCGVQALHHALLVARCVCM